LRILRLQAGEDGQAALTFHAEIYCTLGTAARKNRKTIRRYFFSGRTSALTRIMDVRRLVAQSNAGSPGLRRRTLGQAPA
jgi:hypothetical protein